jgi:hypothetical protein
MNRIRMARTVDYANYPRRQVGPRVVSVIAMLDQHTNNKFNSPAFIDLPSHHAYDYTAP